MQLYSSLNNFWHCLTLGFGWKLTFFSPMRGIWLSRTFFSSQLLNFHCCSVAQWCPTLCDLMDYSMPGFPVHHQIPELAQTHVHWVSDAIQTSHPLLPPTPLTFNLFQHQSLFQWVGSLHQVAKVLELQLQHQSFNDYSGLISFRVDWFDILAVQGTLKSLLQNHSSKALTLQRSAFFMAQLLHPYMLLRLLSHFSRVRLFATPWITPCPSPTPGVHPNSCPLSRWCHQSISSSVIPFPSCPQSFPTSGSFPMSQLFASGSQSIGVSASISVLPVNIQDWFPLGWTGWISLQSKGLSRVFSNTTVQKH